MNIRNFPTMRSKCATCPFREDVDGVNTELAATVLNRIMEASQVCHHPVLYGKKQTHLCRGARDVQLQIFYSLGVIEAATDEAWDKARERLSV